MRRTVILTTTIPLATDGTVQWSDQYGPLGSSVFHLPPDDQLTRDLDLLTCSGLGGDVSAAQARVRAAAGLDDEAS